MKNSAPLTCWIVRRLGDGFSCRTLCLYDMMCVCVRACARDVCVCVRACAGQRERHIAVAQRLADSRSSRSTHVPIVCVCACMYVCIYVSMIYIHICNFFHMCQAQQARGRPTTGYNGMSSSSSADIHGKRGLVLGKGDLLTSSSANRPTTAATKISG